MLYEWNGVVRVVVGEITRAQQLELWRLIRSEDEFDQTEFVIRGELVRATVAVFATRKVSICQGGKWVEVTAPAEHELAEDVVTIGKPQNVSDIENLPRSLANGWVDAAVEVNGGVASLLSFTSASPNSSEAGSELKSEDA